MLEDRKIIVNAAVNAAPPSLLVSVPPIHASVSFLSLIIVYYTHCFPPYCLLTFTYYTPVSLICLSSQVCAVIQYHIFSHLCPFLFCDSLHYLAEAVGALEERPGECGCALTFLLMSHRIKQQALFKAFHIY